MDAVIIAVSHDNFKHLSENDIQPIYKNVPYENRVLIDIKSILDKKLYVKKGYNYFRL
jgi:UDP-N-acetyl-D-galactosamine dehydrogenase